MPLPSSKRTVCPMRPRGSSSYIPILEQGGSRDPMELFVEFRGRQPSIEALLRHNEMIADTEVR